MVILDGKETSDQIKLEIRDEVNKMKLKGERVPHLAAVIVGNDGASLTYVGSKVRSCDYVGFKSSLIEFNNDISEKKLLEEIEKLNHNPILDGYIVQLPLPKHINEQKILLAIDPKKDVDGFHPINLGNLFLGNNNGMIPCTPLGCIYILKKELGSLNGLNAIIVGRSNIVGKPMQSLLLKENCTTTITHSKTKNLSEFTLKADILIAAIGMTEFIDNSYVKDKATIIDVGINRKKINDKIKILGDVNFNDVINKVNLITPVPGGVGPMTIACLMYNTVKASFLRNNHEFKEMIF